jgi:Ulp1 family protease
MDAMIGFIADAHEHDLAANPDTAACFVSSFFFSKLADTATGYDFRALKRWADRTGLQVDASEVFFIVNAGRYHRQLLKVAGIKSGRPVLSVYDSLRTNKTELKTTLQVG